MKYEQLSPFDVCPNGGTCTAESCEDCCYEEESAPKSKDPSEAKFEAPKEVCL
jgi:hypothetical protein